MGMVILDIIRTMPRRWRIHHMNLSASACFFGLWAPLGVSSPTSFPSSYRSHGQG